MNTPTDIYDLPELPDIDVDVDVNIDLSDISFLYIEPSMTLDIPLIPPSVNTCFRTYKGRVIKSKLYREFNKQMEIYFAEKKYEILEGDIKVDIVFYKTTKRKYDIDNRLKALLDSIEGTVFIDDCQITELTVKKHTDCTYNRTIVKIYKLGVS